MPRRSEVTFNKQYVTSRRPESQQKQYRDKHRAGLILRVYPTGKKSYLMEVDRNVLRVVGDADQLTPGLAWTKAKKIQGDYQNKKGAKSKRGKSTTLKAYLEGDYLDLVKAKQKRAAENVARLMAACKPLLNKKLNKITELQIENWVSARLDVAKPTTVKRDLVGLKSALNKAVKPLNLIDENPAGFGSGSVTVDIPEDERVRFLKQAERIRLREALKERDQRKIKGRASGNAHRRDRGAQELPELSGYADYLTPLVLLTMNTGLRRGEVLSLTWKNVSLTDPKAITVKASFSKTNKTRRIPLNSEAVLVLKKWKAQGGGLGLVFPNPATGARMRLLKTSWPNLLRDAGITDFRFHDLRHDFASQLVMKGVNLYRVKELLGHSTIQMTERYAHLDDEALAQAVEVLA